MNRRSFFRTVTGLIAGICALQHKSKADIPIDMITFDECCLMSDPCDKCKADEVLRKIDRKYRSLKRRGKLYFNPCDYSEKSRFPKLREKKYAR